MITASKQRLENLIDGFPAAMAHEFRAYLAATFPASPATAAGAAAPPLFWELLPDWMMGACGAEPSDGARHGSFADDMRWAHYCLFLVFRIHDDYYDGQTGVSSLIYASDLLLIEAEEILARHFPRSPVFWRHYRAAMARTTRAILEVERLQRDGSSDPAAMLGGFAGCAAVFSVVPYAICLRFRRLRLHPRVEHFLAHMTIAGQIMDDLEDIEEDRVQGKWNYVYRRLSNGNGGDAAPSMSALLGKALRAGMFDAVFDSVDEHLAEADAAIAGLRLIDAHAMIQSQRAGVAELRARMHAERVQRVFAGVR